MDKEKLREFLLFAQEKTKIKPKGLIKASKEKLAFAINSYAKYRENFILMKERIRDFGVSYNEIKEFGIKKIEKKKLDEFILNLRLVLGKLAEEL